MSTRTGGGYSDGSGDVSYTYDAYGNVKTETTNGVVNTYTYDKNGNRKSFTQKEGSTTYINATYMYDVLNQLTNVNFGGGIAAAYTYDKNGRLVTENRGVVSSTYTYNKAGLVTSLNNTKGNSYEYTYRLDGKQLTSDDGNYENGYNYNNIGQLIYEDNSVTDIEYTYDTRGNRIVENSESDCYTKYNKYDKNNRLLGENNGSDEYEDVIETTYTYDKNGNMLRKFEETKDGAEEIIRDYDRYYNYDKRNMLKSYYCESNSENETWESEYKYDAAGRRMSKYIDEWKLIKQRWDGSNIVGEFDGTTNEIYYRGKNMIAQKSASSGEISYYVHNAHGDTMGLIDTNGTTVNKYDYYAFGSKLYSSGRTITTSFCYNGQYTDSETGLIYLRNRYYDPTIGRFTQEDPAKDGLNWYVYCANDPVNMVDPFGLRLVLKGTGDEVQTLWNTIKEFSQDELVLTQEVDDYGRLLDSYVVTVAEERSGGCDMGSILVRRIAYSDEVIDVRVWYGENNKYDYDTQTIYFNPYFDPDILTIDSYDGSGYYAKRPSFIGLAHELIHADRDIRGRRLYGSSGYDYSSDERSFWTGKCKIKTDYAPNEELATIGIMYNDWYWDITENDIRAEHGLNLRGAYDV